MVRAILSCWSVGHMEPVKMIDKQDIVVCCLFLNLIEWIHELSNGLY